MGTKNIWKMLFAAGLMDKKVLDKTQRLKPYEWTPDLALEIYSDSADRGLYMTSLVKCTQIDARPLNLGIFRECLPSTYKEIASVRPKAIITFGNLVSSMLLGRKILISKDPESRYEIKIGKSSFMVYPTYYPVGQGMRNMPKAIERIKEIVSMF